MTEENNSEETPTPSDGNATLSADTDSVQIVKGGEVGEDELAALVAGIVAASAVPEPDAELDSQQRPRWSQGAHRHQSFPRHGRDSWRWSLR